MTYSKALAEQASHKPEWERTREQQQAWLAWRQHELREFNKRQAERNPSKDPTMIDNVYR